MTTMYLCFLVGGALIPLISFILGSLSDGLDTDVNTDAEVDMSADVDVQADVDAFESVFSIELLPSSFMSFSAMAIAFGAVGGVLSLTGKGKLITLVAAIISGYIASVIVQTIVKTLKKAQKRNYGIDEQELLLYDGKVVDTILPGQLGSVSFVTLKGVRLSYPAKCADEKLKLETGKIVKVNEIKNGIFIVEPKNKYE